MGKVLSMQYFEALKMAMAEISRIPNSIFIGQGVGCAGTTMTDTLMEVPEDKLLEFPVAEDLQMGVAIGMALDGMLPVCIYPRWNFFLLGANQLVNHLDRIPTYSRGEFNPRVVIRVAVPSTAPFYPGPQHDDDFTEAFQMMLRNVKVARLQTAEAVIREYRKAQVAAHSTILVEYTDLYRSCIPSGVNDANHR